MRERDVVAGREAGLLDGFDDEVEAPRGCSEVGGEAALVAEAGGQPAAFSTPLRTW